MARFLRPDVRIELVGSLRGEDGLEGAGVAVDVVLPRAAAEIVEVILLDAEAEADTGDVHGLLLGAVERGHNLQEAAGEEGIVHGHGTSAREGINGVEGSFFDGHLGLKGLGSFFPGIGSEGLIVAVVVVGGAAPEVRAQAEVRIEQVASPVGITPDNAERLVEDQDSLAGFEADLGLAFRHFRRPVGFVRLQGPRVL